MAIKHYLYLDIPDTACVSVLKITDTSVYATGLAVDCLRLDITLPGNTQPIYLTVDELPALVPGFVLNLSPIELQLQASNCTELITLPDGLYTITYSISPNDLVNVTYYHLRVTKTLNKLYNELCKIQLERCEPTKEVMEKLEELRFIQMYIAAAKAKAEYCNAPNQAVDMLRYAIRLLDKFQNSCCTSCH